MQHFKLFGLTLLFGLLISNLSAQNQPKILQEVKLNNGKTIIIYENGTWKEKVFKKPDIAWVDVKGGTFTMGSPSSEVDRHDDEIQHQVTLSAFKMSKYEITFEQFDLFCEATNRSKPSDEGWGRGTRPVINVTWDDAVAFADWMGCRLPTEAEWEYACRAGSTTPFSSGNNLTSDNANVNGYYSPYNNNPKSKTVGNTVPVGSYLPNNWGLFDMHGNVSEWCLDSYKSDIAGTQNNPKFQTEDYFKVYRGGSYTHRVDLCRSSYRGQELKNENKIDLGFRVVLK